jgi:hypothetical protein
MKSINEQIEAMKEKWGNEFALVEQTGNSAHWIGRLTPNNTTYKIQIFYRVPFVIEDPRPSRFQPSVQVLDPLLRSHPKTYRPAPHVYTNDEDPERPYLCLFDPQAGEWSVDMLIAGTTVPWTSLHLHYYEGWLLTGKWLGPERHPGNNDAESAAKKRSATVSRVTSGPSAAVVMARLETFSHP